MTIPEYQQGPLLATMRAQLYEMAYGKTPSGFRYDACDQIASAFVQVTYAIEELERIRCTDGEGSVSHDGIGDVCRKCGSFF